MNKEEKEIIEQVKEELKRVHKINHLSGTYVPIDYLEIMLNLIQKQEHEIGLLKEQKQYVIDQYGETIEKQEKIIDKMAEQLNKFHSLRGLDEDCFIPREYSDINDCIKKQSCKECIIEYFKKECESDEI